MHKSKLSGFIIDCQTEDLESAAKFWGSALGLPETDDIEAEVRRLEGLGAKRVAQIKSWWSWKLRPASGSAS